MFLENENETGTESGNENDQWKMPDEGDHVMNNIQVEFSTKFLRPSTKLEAL